MVGRSILQPGGRRTEKRRAARCCPMPISIKRLSSDDAGVLRRVAPGVFDHEIDGCLVEEFLNDPRHHLVVALDASTVVGIVSGVHYVHPDKSPELWINEVGVAATHRRRGIARRLIDAMLGVARDHGCREAWVLADRSNRAAMALYASVEGAERPVDQALFSFELPAPGA